MPANPFPDVALPPAAVGGEVWDRHAPAHRVVWGVDRTTTDHPATVHTSAIQLADGSIDVVGNIEAPQVFLHLGDRGGFNSDQARELAAALLEAAAELDGWTR
ncbi:hypothetical protein MPRG_18480 [Mycobacterium paragordonae]|uniref:Uncharacterized protein n=2 Tax=Mycobacterium paragordonae TaxID=1389713 RepID=A0ABQ1C2T2_9MYCO|nr:hypothetical protein MPRG_18480 [Mycobacterium paragordonae]